MSDLHLTITPAQAAKRLQISMTTMYEWIRQEGFPKLYVGRKILIPLAALERWLDEQVDRQKTGVGD